MYIPTYVYNLLIGLPQTLIRTLRRLMYTQTHMYTCIHICTDINKCTHSRSNELTNRFQSDECVRCFPSLAIDFACQTFDLFSDCGGGVEPVDLSFRKNRHGKPEVDSTNCTSLFFPSFLVPYFLGGGREQGYALFCYMKYTLVVSHR